MRAWLRCLSVFVLAGLLSVASHAQNVFVPKDDFVLLHVASAVREINDWSGKHHKPSLAEKIDQYLLAYRQDGDHRWLQLAQAALNDEQVAQVNQIDRLIIQADLLQLQHEFSQALEVLNYITHLNKNSAQAWLTKSNIHALRGEIQQAKNSCAQLTGILGISYVALCLANIDYNQAQPRAALNKLDSIQSHFTQKNVALQSQVLAWYHTLRAESYGALDQIEQAQKYYLLAQQVYQAELGQPVLYWLISYADFLISNDNFQQAKSLLDGAPTTPAVLFRLARVNRALNVNDAFMERKVEQSLQWLLTRPESGHDRELAYYYLHVDIDNKLAFLHAQTNWREQKEPFDQLLLVSSAKFNCSSKQVEQVLAKQDANLIEHLQLKDEYGLFMEACS